MQVPYKNLKIKSDPKRLVIPLCLCFFGEEGDARPTFSCNLDAVTRIPRLVISNAIFPVWGILGANIDISLTK